MADGGQQPLQAPPSADVPLDAAPPTPHGGLLPKAAPASSAAYRAGRTDGPLRCTWYPGMPAGERAKDPHAHVQRVLRRGILPNVLACIGETPCVRLNRIPRAEGVPEGVDVVAKLEMFNPGGSVKDRIGYSMVAAAERDGKIAPGATLIEPTSGNTGIGIALAAAVKGYKAIITLPMKMSAEKVGVLKALGAEIIRTPTEAAWDAPESHIGVAKRLRNELPNSHILDQYSNIANPMAHYDGTAEEIWEQCEGQVDMVVLGAGTGGTLTGVARKLKEKNPRCIVVGVDPKGSILAEPDALNDEKRLQSYQVEGIGYDFVPTVLDRSVVDFWVKVDDAEALVMARRMIREEGMLVGGSSGTAMVAACQAAKRLKPGQRCVVVCPDSIRNYMTKHLQDSWMYAQGFVSEEHGIGVTETPKTWWASRVVADLSLTPPSTAGPGITVQDAVELLTRLGFDQLPVVDEANAILGVVTEGNLSALLLAGRVKPTDPISKALLKGFRKVSVTTHLGELARVFDTDHFAMVTASQRVYGRGGAVEERSVLVGVLTRIDLLRYITANAKVDLAAGASGASGTGSGTPTSPSFAAAAAAGGCPVMHARAAGAGDSRTHTGV